MPPFGGFICINDHLQCSKCNQKNYGQCGICDNVTSFVQMKMVAPTHHLAIIQAQIADLAINQPPSAPPMNSSSTAKEMFTSKTPFVEIIRRPPSHTNRQDTQTFDGEKQNVGDKLPPSHPTDQNIVKIAIKEEPDASAFVSQNSSKTFAFFPDCDSDAIAKLERDCKSIETLAYTPDNNIETQMSISHKAREQHKETMNHPHYCRPVRDGYITSESPQQMNILVLDDDLEDAIIDTSEIRFMDSAESLKGLYLTGTSQCTKNSIECETKNSHSSNKSCCYDHRAADGLSTKALLDFEAQNTAKCGEVVENYLRSCGPMTYSKYSTCNCQNFQSDLIWGLQWTEKTAQDGAVRQMKSACVSTESDPSLGSANVRPPLGIEVTLPAKFPAQEFLVMRTMGVTKPDSDVLSQTSKTGRPNLDMRMQKILETFQEDPYLKLKENDKQSKGNLLKMPASSVQAKPQTQISAKAEPPTTDSQNQVAYELTESAGQINLLQNNSVLRMHLINVHRAYYNPSLPSLLEWRNQELVPQDPPPPQHQLIPCSAVVAQELLKIKARFLRIKPVPASLVNILRTPIRCPESTCQRMTFVSDFNKHLVIDHNYLPMERITPFQVKSFFLDPRIARCGTTKSHLLYLLRDKITDLGVSEHKDFLPLVVMSSRINLAQICSLNEKEHGDHIEIARSTEFLIIWLTGIAPEDSPISVSLTVWANSGETPKCHLVYSGELYPIRMSQKGIDVFKSGNMLILTALELDLLTEGGTQMINAQLVVH
uniref:DUF4729 domain-containing protein n=1 Tax=Glossina pallidipes TaxID=7398 RepID=A0A1B0A803_GLOPL